MSVGQLARHRSSSSSSRPAIRTTTPYSTDKEFEPCAATASIFLYAQGSTIICLHHDTLAIDRRFELHQERILFLSVDNVSERGAGRLVVSYDAGQTAIVWDLFTGDEIARFASYEPIRVAAWMKNGNVAFGKPTAQNVKKTLLMWPREFARECHSLRTFYIGAHLSQDYIRSHHSDCSSSRLSDLCSGVSLSNCAGSNMADVLSGIRMGQSYSSRCNHPSPSCTRYLHLARRHQSPT